MAVRNGRLLRSRPRDLDTNHRTVSGWEQRIVIQGRQRTLGLGGVQLVTLAEAREKALANRKIARAGGDPMDHRRQVNIPTFEAAAADVIELHRPSWRNAKHAAQWDSTLRTYVYPRLGKRRVSDIDTAEILNVLTPIWHKKAETARRVRQRISTVMKWAVANGSPCTRWIDLEIQAVAVSVPARFGGLVHEGGCQSLVGMLSLRLATMWHLIDSLSHHLLISGLYEIRRAGARPPITKKSQLSRI